MLLPARKTAEFIPGYTLCERIGAGGYGEVWKADAPGGLLKAVKFVFGRLDQERAARELKALSRIREVRHPFVLSLERIEILDGQLVVITELADASLRDRFDACRAENKPGIPRDELLAYLRDAADALDYMSESFSLQHLDVKPENLLLVGGRVKVADFGLVKDIHDATVSLMGGLTPIYAAPEVFDGHPSLRSDQYSLAIVYQEMLTGVRPFSGQTPTQLAAQHLHGSPRLTPLPAKDCAIVARALEKAPSRRFPSCRALVDTLLQQGDPRHADQAAKEARAASSGVGDTTSVAAQAHDTALPADAQPARIPRQAEPSPSARTLPLEPLGGLSNDGNPGREWIPAASRDAKTSGDWPLPLTNVEPSIEDMPPLELDAGETGLRPVLVIGVGGTAASVLRQLRKRWFQRFGDPAAMPAFQMLLVDTNPQSIAEARVGEPAAALDDGQTLLAMLRKPDEYRDAWEEHSRWLSRRWLCNLPRSQRTEGLRPLGRLALVDHAQEVLARLRDLITGIAATEALAASARHSEMSVRDAAPSIILVASISGGTGSGMVLDLAYIVRKILAEHALSDASLRGILVHSTGRQAGEKMLAILNSCACLRELRYYSCGKGYPGDMFRGLRAFDPAIPPFDDTCVVHLGDELSDTDFHDKVEDLSVYLDLATSTSVGALLDKYRVASAVYEERGEEPTVRSFGLHRWSSSPNDLGSAGTESMRESVDRALPRLYLGGRRRIFLTCPATSDAGMWRNMAMQDMGLSPSVLVNPCGSPILGCELEGLPLARVAGRLIEERADYARIARRLQTRVDVTW